MQEGQSPTGGEAVGTGLAPVRRYSTEAQIAFGTLLRRLPNLRLARSPEELTWDQSFLLRGLTSLPVTF